MNFETFEEFLDAFAKNTDLAFAPIPLVAQHLNVTPASISAMLRDKRLEEIRISNGRYVLLKSLNDRQSRYLDDIAKVEAFLINLAKQGTSSVFYEPVMQAIGLSWRVPADRTKIGKILGAISERSWKEHKFLLSVLVHRKTAGITRPGPGFFELASDGLGLNWEDDDQFVKRQTSKVISHFRDQK